MRPKTIVEEIFEDGIAQGISIAKNIDHDIAQAIANGITHCIAFKRDEYIRSLIGLGLLTDEQIAIAMKQTPEYVAKLRVELEATQN